MSVLTKHDGHCEGEELGEEGGCHFPLLKVLTVCASSTLKKWEKTRHLKVKWNELFASFLLTKHISKAKFESLRKIQKLQNDSKNSIDLVLYTNPHYMEAERRLNCGNISEIANYEVFLNIETYITVRILSDVEFKTFKQAHYALEFFPVIRKE